MKIMGHKVDSFVFHSVPVRYIDYIKEYGLRIENEYSKGKILLSESAKKETLLELSNTAEALVLLIELTYEDIDNIEIDNEFPNIYNYKKDIPLERLHVLNNKMGQAGEEAAVPLSEFELTEENYKEWVWCIK